MTDKLSLWDDLKRRRVVRAVAIYAVVGWGAFEVTESVSPILDFPEWVPRVVLFVLLLGFPLVAGLAWAFDVDRSGVQRADTSDGRSRMWMAVGGAALLAAAIGVYTVRTAFDAPDLDALDTSSVAVVPFRASLGPELGYLGEGMVDLIAGRLSEEDGLRAVDPASIFAALARQSGLPTQEDLIRVAQRSGAARLLSGSLAGLPQRLEVNAELLDVRNGESVASASVTGSADSLPALVDELVSRVLSLQAGERQDRVGALAGSPPDALRAYLEGRSLYRSGDYLGATDAFTRAIREDSTFALAGMALSNAAGMSLLAPPGSATLGNRTAWNHKDRLPRADREFLVYRLGEYYPESRTDRERIAAGEEATRRFPDRIEAWYLYADRVFHEHRGVGLEEGLAIARRGFDRMLELDPNHVVALQHRSWIANMTGEPESVRSSFAERMLKLSANAAVRWQAAHALGRHEIVTPIEDDLDAGDDETVMLIGLWHATPVLAPPDVELDHRMADRVIEIMDGRASSPVIARTLFSQELNRGRPATATAQLERVRSSSGARASLDLWLTLGSILSVVDPETGSAAAARLEQRWASGGETPADRIRQVRDLCVLELWKLDRGDATTADASADFIRGLSFEGRGFPMEAEGCARLVEAAHAVVTEHPDAVRYVDALEEWAIEGPPMFWGIQSGIHQLLGRMRQSLGDLDGAQRALARCCRLLPTTNFAWIADATFELGEVALARGDVATAINAFDHYVRVRETAAPELQESVEYARSQLSRLAAGN